MGQRRIENIRNDFDDIDRKIHELLSKRCELSEEIGKLKKEQSLNVIQLKRWKEVLNNRFDQSKKNKINTTFISKIYNLIHEESVRIQHKVFEK